MGYYIAAFFWFYVSVFFAMGCRNLRSEILLIGMLPLILLVILRGNVGTDTLTYLSAFQNWRVTGVNVLEFEPLFQLIYEGAAYFIESDRVVVAFFGLLITFIFLLAASRIDKKGIIFGACFVPIFYLDMTMNGLRYGLSFAIALLSVAELLRVNERRFWITATAAGLVHLSGLALAILFYMVVKGLRIKFKVVLLGVSIFGFFLFHFFSTYLAQRLDAYEVILSPSAVSGLAPLALSLITLLVVVLDPEIRKSRVFPFVALASMSILSFVLSRFSYAGLRVQVLVLFLIFMVLQFHVVKEKIILQRNTVGGLIFVGFVGLLAKMRNINDDFGAEGSPFAPYHFFWEVIPIAG
jgi:hypothetical protein